MTLTTISTNATKTLADQERFRLLRKLPIQQITTSDMTCRCGAEAKFIPFSTTNPDQQIYECIVCRCLAQLT